MCVLMHPGAITQLSENEFIACIGGACHNMVTRGRRRRHDMTLAVSQTKTHTGT